VAGAKNERPMLGNSESYFDRREGSMWLVLQPILMIGMLLNDDVLALFVMAVLAAQLANDLFSAIFLQLMNLRDWCCTHDGFTKVFSS
jgi:hypothetical protein